MIIKKFILDPSHQLSNNVQVEVALPQALSVTGSASVSQAAISSQVMGEMIWGPQQPGWQHTGDLCGD